MLLRFDRFFQRVTTRSDFPQPSLTFQEMQPLEDLTCIAVSFGGLAFFFPDISVAPHISKNLKLSSAAPDSPGSGGPWSQQIGLGMAWGSLGGLQHWESDRKRMGFATKIHHT